MIDWWGSILYEYYASAEGAGMTLIDSHRWLAEPGSGGQAVLGTVRICDETRRKLPAGQVGMVHVERSDTEFEYPGDPGRTAAARRPWWPHCATVGDLGHVDAAGDLLLTDRKAFVIISGASTSARRRSRTPTGKPVESTLKARYTSPGET